MPDWKPGSCMPYIETILYYCNSMVIILILLFYFQVVVVYPRQESRCTFAYGGHYSHSAPCNAESALTGHHWYIPSLNNWNNHQLQCNVCRFTKKNFWVSIHMHEDSNTLPQLDYRQLGYKAIKLVCLWKNSLVAIQFIMIGCNWTGS